MESTGTLTPQVLIVDLLRNLKVEGGEEKCDVNDFEDIRWAIKQHGTEVTEFQHRKRRVGCDTNLELQHWDLEAAAVWASGVRGQPGLT